MSTQWSGSMVHSAQENEEWRLKNSEKYHQRRQAARQARLEAFVRPDDPDSQNGLRRFVGKGWGVKPSSDQAVIKH